MVIRSNVSATHLRHAVNNPVLSAGYSMIRGIGQADDIDPGFIPSLRVRLPRARLEAIDKLIPEVFTDRSDAIRQLCGIGLQHLNEAFHEGARDGA
jgi:hypothetical protein